MGKCAFDHHAAQLTMSLVSKESSTQLPPPPPPPTPSPLNAKCPSTQPESNLTAGSTPSDANARKHPLATVRPFSKRSRQDGLLEENPPPPRSPRRTLSRSPGPRTPRCSVQDNEVESTTPMCGNHASSSGGRTPGYGCHTAVGFPTPTSSSQTAYGSTTPHFAAQTPRYCGNSPDYGSGAPSLYRARTPHQGSRTPAYGGTTSSAGTTPYQSSQPRYYGSQTPAYRSPGPRTSNYVPTSPSYSGDNRDREVLSAGRGSSARQCHSYDIQQTQVSFFRVFFSLLTQRNRSICLLILLRLIR
ncbi:unnamed protein product [Strongylus vulgaris]|uniref:Uncharacterized protein n=1 Tax=Strongylus vulgaris TaxID=40348 RepID=A0A3P7I1X8_STRVU|nr:unnamed protein product [Strongylus vulgaris]